HTAALRRGMPQQERVQAGWIQRHRNTPKSVEVHPRGRSIPVLCDRNLHLVIQEVIPELRVEDEYDIVASRPGVEVYVLQHPEELRLVDLGVELLQNFTPQSVRRELPELDSATQRSHEVLALDRVMPASNENAIGVTKYA